MTPIPLPGRARDLTLLLGALLLVASCILLTKKGTHSRSTCYIQDTWLDAGGRYKRWFLPWRSGETHEVLGLFTDTPSFRPHCLDPPRLLHPVIKRPGWHGPGIYTILSV